MSSFNVSDIDPGFGHWVAGLTDGEGSFIIPNNAKQPNSPGCRFALGLRSDDTPALEEICRQTGLGGVCADVPKNITRWTVGSQGDCQHLVELFTRFPLRAKKRHDFNLWSRAVAIAADSTRPRADRAIELAEIRWKLREQRVLKCGERPELPIKICRACQGPHLEGTVRCPRCGNTPQRERDFHRLYEMWHKGMLLREIAEEMGWTIRHVQAQNQRMRELGFDMPLRNIGWRQKRRELAETRFTTPFQPSINRGQPLPEPTGAA